VFARVRWFTRGYHSGPLRGRRGRGAETVWKSDLQPAPIGFILSGQGQGTATSLEEALVPATPTQPPNAFLTLG
jgi:hypothetical protein